MDSPAAILAENTPPCQANFMDINMIFVVCNKITALGYF
jgi:hypothetical protein